MTGTAALYKSIQDLGSSGDIYVLLTFSVSSGPDAPNGAEALLLLPMGTDTSACGFTLF